jgi:hypothetical protein
LFDHQLTVRTKTVRIERFISTCEPCQASSTESRKDAIRSDLRPVQKSVVFHAHFNAVFGFDVTDTGPSVTFAFACALVKVGTRGFQDFDPRSINDDDPMEIVVNTKFFVSML